MFCLKHGNIIARQRISNDLRLNFETIGSSRHIFRVDFLQAVNPRANLRELLYMYMLIFFRVSTTTENNFNNSKNKDTMEKTKPEKYGGPIKLQYVIVIVYGFLYFAITTGSVYHYKKKEYGKGNNGYFGMLFRNK